MKGQSVNQRRSHLKEESEVTHKHPTTEPINLIGEDLAETVHLKDAVLPDGFLDPVSNLAGLLDEIRPLVLLLEKLCEPTQLNAKKSIVRNMERHHREVVRGTEARLDEAVGARWVTYAVVDDGDALGEKGVGVVHVTIDVKRRTALIVDEV